MPTIGTNSKPAYVYDAGTDTWIPIGPGEHTHDYASSAHNHDSTYIAKTLTTTTGDIIYASAANTPARLGIGSTDQVLKVSGGIPAWGAAPAASFVGCSLNSTNPPTTLTNNTYQVMNWDGEEYDSDNFHNNSTNNSRITIPSGKAGKYLFVGNGTFDNNWGTPTVLTGLYKNGSLVSRSLWGFTPSTNNAANVGFAIIQSAAVGDYFEMVMFQNSGANRTPPYPQNFAFQATYLGA